MSSLPFQQHMQLPLTGFERFSAPVEPFRLQLLKWIGNKQRFAHEIIRYFPARFGTYFEPFVGSGAVLGTLAPRRAIAGDVIPALIELWQTLVTEPGQLKEWYAERWHRAQNDKEAAYARIRDHYNACPNAADFVFISRACYGGVVRFRQNDGGISTPCGAHRPISPESFNRRVDVWRSRVGSTRFVLDDFEAVVDSATVVLQSYPDNLPTAESYTFPV